MSLHGLTQRQLATALGFRSSGLTAAELQPLVAAQSPRVRGKRVLNTGAPYCPPLTLVILYHRPPQKSIEYLFDFLGGTRLNNCGSESTRLNIFGQEESEGINIPRYVRMYGIGYLPFPLS